MPPADNGADADRTLAELLELHIWIPTGVVPDVIHSAEPEHLCWWPVDVLVQVKMHSTLFTTDSALRGKPNAKDPCVFEGPCRIPSTL
jgi:hypothetical protein